MLLLLWIFFATPSFGLADPVTARFELAAEGRELRLCVPGKCLRWDWVGLQGGLGFGRRSRSRAWVRDNHVLSKTRYAARMPRGKRWHLTTLPRANIRIWISLTLPPKPTWSWWLIRCLEAPLCIWYCCCVCWSAEELGPPVRTLLIYPQVVQSI